MAKPRRKTPPAELFNGSAEDAAMPSPAAPPIPEKEPAEEVDLKSVRHVEASDFVSRLNQTVSAIHSFFQDRDHLLNEIEALKSQLGIGKEIALERQLLVSLKREKEGFLYQWEREKIRKQQEAEESQKALEAALKKRDEDQRSKLARESEEQSARLEREEEDHNRKLKLETEDFDRAKKLFTEEKAVFQKEQEIFKKEREDLKKRLLSDLDIENKHSREVSELNHQRELAVLRGELELEKSARAKMEASLKDAYAQIDRLSAQLAQLSREALTSASSSAMVNRLEGMVAQIAGGSRKGKEDN